MKYKEFIAKAAIEIMAAQCKSFKEDEFVVDDEDNTILGPSIKIENAALNAVIAAKILAIELEDDFVYKKKDLENNHKMYDYEDFFEEYEV